MEEKCAEPDQIHLKGIEIPNPLFSERIRYARCLQAGEKQTSVYCWRMPKRKTFIFPTLFQLYHSPIFILLVLFCLGFYALSVGLNCLNMCHIHFLFLIFIFLMWVSTFPRTFDSCHGSSLTTPVILYDGSEEELMDTIEREFSWLSELRKLFF